MLLLTDGTVMCKSGSGGASYGNQWNKLTPDSKGSYVNGTWTTLSPMNDTRLYFASQVLKDGRVFVAGGEYGTGGAKGETYNSLTDTWTEAPAPGSTISDANSLLMPDGRVLVALVTGNLKTTTIFDPVANTWTAGPTCNGIHNESVWVQVPDGSTLFVDRLTTNSERYIPSLNQWIVDGTVPVALYDGYGDEAGPGFLLPNGQAFFIGSPSNTAYYTPSGSTSPGHWSTGPTIPNAQGAPDAPGAMMANGKILCVLSPTPTSSNHFPSPSTFYEFDYTTNTFTAILGPNGASTTSMSTYVANMLDLPDGSVLYCEQGYSQYYVYNSGGTPLAAGQPTVTSISPNGDGSYHLVGTQLNGISQGAIYGDDWQMSTNYPIVRLTSECLLLPHLQLEQRGCTDRQHSGDHGVHPARIAPPGRLLTPGGGQWHCVGFDSICDLLFQSRGRHTGRHGDPDGSGLHGKHGGELQWRECQLHGELRHADHDHGAGGSHDRLHHRGCPRGHD